jgi:RHS repeat-associated protein
LNQSGVSNYHTPGQGGTPTSITVNRTGRYVRVQLVNPGLMSLAEVEVWGAAGGATYRASTDFTSTQGQNNWYYVDENGLPMTYDAVNNVWVGSEGPYQWLWSSGGHPGAAHDVVRQWRAPSAGSIRITGNASDGHTACGDGVIVSIKKGATVLWQQTIANGNTTGLNYDLTTSVASGDQINFVINRNGDAYCDSTTFDPTITFSSGGGGGSPAKINWLVTDQLGTPRIILDQTGSLANMSRHDYLPFGEEVPANFRTGIPGYANGDNVRQKFTSKERDNETGLDYFLARYYAKDQGRFTGVDPQNIIFDKEQGRNEEEQNRILQSYLVQPQNWNRYAYTRNSPVSNRDPNGKCSAPAGLSKGNVGICIEAFIAAPSVRGAKGDNRDFAANDPSKTFRVQVQGVITRGHFGWSAELKADAGVTRLAIGVVPGFKGKVTLDKTSESVDKNGNYHIGLKITGTNGFSAAFGKGDQEKIVINVNLVITPDGKVGIEQGSKSTNYPSMGFYSYNVGPDGKPMSNVIIELGETTVSALTRPLEPIGEIAPSRCPESPGCIRQ